LFSDSSHVINYAFSDPPLVTVHKVFSHQKSSLYLELACWVDSNPPCKPKWAKLGENGKVMNISPKSDIEKSVWVEQRGEFSVVVIENPKDNHMGGYICTATNIVGEDYKIISLRGKFTCNSSR